MPSTRSTNAGFLIVTHEFDCKTKEQFEETLAWSTNSGPFADLDKELQKYRDYRGYCILFAGRRSIHFDFLFNTRHLKNAPFDADFEQRLAAQQIHAAIMPKVHRIYWDPIDSLIETILTPSLKSDRQLRSIFQWRRTPWGTRVLSEPSEILDLPAGTAVPQLVIKENIRTKAAKGSDAWILGGDATQQLRFSRASIIRPIQPAHRQ
jgi:hypothetical protein